MPWLTAVLPVLVLAITLFNVAAWPRGRRRKLESTVSVLIPARNEEATIEACVAAALAQPVLEVIVYDDQSTDQTAGVLRRMAERDHRLRVETGGELPQGWIGKPHGCHRLAGLASGEVLLFVDADVTLLSGAVERLVGLLNVYDAQVASAVPRQVVGSFVERLVLPLLHLTYLSWLPLPLIWRTRSTHLLAANGQLIAVRRAAYADVGFDAVRTAIVDDMEFCRAHKRVGHRVVFADGHHIASCRMYGSARDVWDGFSKNIFEGLGGVTGLALAVVLYGAAFLWPWLALGLGLVGTPWLLFPGLVGVGANVVQRVVLVARYGHPLESVALHPLAVATLSLIAVNSWIWHLRDNIVWSGRRYPRKESRG